jgi:hypothetical protein
MLERVDSGFPDDDSIASVNSKVNVTTVTIALRTDNDAVSVKATHDPFIKRAECRPLTSKAPLPWAIALVLLVFHVLAVFFRAVGVFRGFQAE